MAGKHSILIPYKIVDALSGGTLSGEDRWRFIESVVAYERSGTPPDFTKGESYALWMMLKPEIDANKEKYQGIVEQRRKSGKLGGAPEGNTNAAGNRGGGAPRGNRNAVKKTAPENKHNQLLVFETEGKKQTQADKVKDKDKDKDNVDGIGSSTAACGGGEVVLEKQPANTTTNNNNIFIFQKECERLGFSITEAKAGSLLQKGLNHEWLTGQYTFPEDIAAYVNCSYSEKTPEERLKLFLSALEWEDKWAEYQDFLDGKRDKAHKTKPYQRDNHRISADEVRDEDISKYFKEI